MDNIETGKILDRRADPTPNVLLIMRESSRRQDDILRESIHRIEGLMASNFLSSDVTFKNHCIHDREMQAKEAERINGILSTIIQTAAAVNNGTLETAQTLATSIQSKDDQARITAQASADKIAQLLTLQNEANNKRFNDLETAKWESGGRSGVTDPMMADLMAEVRALKTAQTTTTTETGIKFGGLGDLGKLIMPVIMAILALIVLLK